MGDSSIPNTPPNPDDQQKPKEEQGQRDFTAEPKPETPDTPSDEPTLDIPPKPQEGEPGHDMLEPTPPEQPKPPDMTPPTLTPEPQPEAGGAEEEKPPQPQTEPYEVPLPLGELITQNLKDLGLGGQIALGGAVLCFFSSFLWSWNSNHRGLEWFVVMIMFFMSIETIVLISLLMPDKYAAWRKTLRTIIFVPGGHITFFCLLALLFGERLGSIVCLIGGIAICVGNYIATLKAKNA